MKNPEICNSVLIVEDNVDMQHLLSDIVKEAGYRPYKVSNGSKAIEKFKIINPDVVILDIKLPDKNGFQVLAEIRNIKKDAIAIIISANDDYRTEKKAMDMEVFAYFSKPFNNSELISILKKAVNAAIF